MLLFSIYQASFRLRASFSDFGSPLLAMTIPAHTKYPKDYSCYLIRI